MILLVVLLCASTARANDRGITGTGGRLRVAGGEHTSVQMLRETVSMQIFSDLCYVTAEFEFKNHGPATVVTMGFPEGGAGGIDYQAARRKSGFWAFRSSVDGQAVACRRQTVTVDPQRDTYLAHWVKQVHFAAGQTRRVRVYYVSSVGEIASGERFVSYAFTGGNWRGKVEESRIKVSVQPADFKPLNSADFKPLSSGHSKWNPVDGGYAMVLRNWEAEQEVAFHYAPGQSGYVLPKSGSVVLTEADLRGKDGTQLTLIRNEIFARCGRPFRDAKLRAHFAQQPWYREFPGYRDEMLGSLMRNAEFVAQYQRTHQLY